MRTKSGTASLAAAPINPSERAASLRQRLLAFTIRKSAGTALLANGPIAPRAPTAAPRTSSSSSSSSVTSVGTRVLAPGLALPSRDLALSRVFGPRSSRSSSDTSFSLTSPPSCVGMRHSSPFLLTTSHIFSLTANSAPVRLLYSATASHPPSQVLFFTLNREDFSFVIHLDRQPRTSRRREAQTGSRARSGSRSERTLDAVEHSRTLMEWWPFLIFHRGGLRIKVINNTRYSTAAPAPHFPCGVKGPGSLPLVEGAR